MKHRLTYSFYEKNDSSDPEFNGQWIGITCSRCNCVHRVAPVKMLYRYSPGFFERFYMWSWIIESYQILLAQVPTCEDAINRTPVQNTHAINLPLFGKLTTGYR